MLGKGQNGRIVVITYKPKPDTPEPGTVVMHYDDPAKIQVLARAAMQMRPDRITVEFER